MAQNKNLQKLELTWIGKGEEPKLEPRILIENPEYSYGDPNTENMLIHGDNLLALKALEQDYAGRVKCIYIDPPYNTGHAFEHYDDGIEHSIWLNLMYQRLKYLYKLLSEDGVIWITLDDNESHYCKIICDEVFGRHNFLANVVWEKSDSPKMDAKFFSSRHDHILVYAKKIDSCKINRIINDDDIPKHYNKLDSAGRIYYLKPLRAMGADGYREKRPSMYYSVTAPDGTEIFPKNPDGSDSRWRWSKEKLNKDIHLLEWIKTKDSWSLYFKIFWDNNNGLPPESIWHHEKVGTNRTSKKEIKDLFNSQIFDTPKPEKLIDRVIGISTNPGDLVLDSFLGSGTTAAVAHKMGRKYIGIELGEHAITHCYPRLKQVVDGEQGGISKAINWQGGGGFKFYTLAPSLLKKDKFGQWIMSDEYNADMLAAAMAKQEGFKYNPSETQFWKQGNSSEQDFIFTTTQFLTVQQLEAIAEDMQAGESLLICCKAFQPECKNKFPNITIKKIPEAVIERFKLREMSDKEVQKKYRDDYSFKIINLPQDYRTEDEYEDEKSDEEGEITPDNQDNNQPTLFD